MVNSWMVSSESERDHSWMKRKVYIWLDRGSEVRHEAYCRFRVTDSLWNGTGRRNNGGFGGGYKRTMWLLNLHGGGNVPDERMWSKAALSLTQVSAVSLNWIPFYCRINPLGY